MTNTQASKPDAKVLKDYQGPVLLERFDERTALYLEKSDGLLLVHKPDAERRIVYRLTAGTPLVDPGFAVHRWDNVSEENTVLRTGGWTLFLEGLQTAGTPVSLANEIFPDLPDLQRKEFGLQPVNEPLEDSRSVNRYSFSLIRICHYFRSRLAHDYPMSYLALIYTSPDRDKLCRLIAQNGGKLTSQHLALALGMERITQGQKRWLRNIQVYDPESFYEQAREICSNWDSWFWMLVGTGKHKAPEAKTCQETLRWFLRVIKDDPFLQQVPWCHVDHAFELGSDQITEAWLYACDHRGYTGKRESFMLHYVQNAGHYFNLLNAAEDERQRREQESENLPDDTDLPGWPGGLVMPDYVWCHFELLETVGDIRRVAEQLNNCAKGYIQEVLEGRSYLVGFDTGMDERHAAGREIGLLQLDVQALQQLAGSEQLPGWDTVHATGVLRQFSGVDNVDMSDHAWRELHWFLCELVQRVWEKQHKPGW